MALYELSGANGLLLVYEDHVQIVRTDPYVAQAFGDKEISYASLESVRFKRGGAFFNGFIQLCIRGESKKSEGALKATQDENTVMIKSDQNEDAEAITRYLNSKIYDRQNY